MGKKETVSTRTASAKRRTRPKKPRLFSRGIVLGCRRSRHKSSQNRSIIQIEGVSSLDDTKYYMGKRVAFQYALPEDSTARRTNAKKFLEGKRVIYGSVTRHHGNSGCVQVDFDSNLPGWSVGMKCRVYMYPQNE